METKTLATFKSNLFNSTEPKDYFINPGCFGDDLAKWLANKLAECGTEITVEPEQEDFGWYFTFVENNTMYNCIIGFQPDNTESHGNWICHVQRKRRFLNLFAWNRHAIKHNAISNIYKILSESPHIHDLRWHFETDFDKQ